MFQLHMVSGIGALWPKNLDHEFSVAAYFAEAAKAKKAMQDRFHE